MPRELRSPDPSPGSAGAAEREVHGLFLKHIDVVRGFIRALVRDRHLADDVLQETFLTLTRKAADFRPGTSFPKWACAVARLKVLEARRQQAGRLRFFSEEVMESLAGSHEPDPGPDERLDLLDDCIDELPPSMRRMIRMRYQGSRKPSDIAERVGWSVEAVYVALSRARTALRDCLNFKLNQQEGSA